MHKRWRYILLLTGLVTGCGQAEGTESYYIQEISHLQPEVSLSGSDSTETDSAREVLNYETIRGVWIPFMLYGEWMQGKDAEGFRACVCEAWDNCTELGLNTLYVHVRAYGDAYYPSDLFAPGSYWDGSYDPLAIMLEEAHKRSLSVHAWINPMRCTTPERLAATDASYPLRKWYDGAETNGTWLVQSGELYYLNPAYAETRQLIADGVTEILEQYAVDGIHIDDYFYPTTDPAFDAQAFAESGAKDLAQWRRDNCTKMVQAIYAAVKAVDERLLFGISPQGNLSGNYEKLYADTAAWCSAENCCDYIVPQLYYGFQNSTCPFAETAAVWCNTAQSVQLVLGLAAYKIGTADQWAGDGLEEWLTDDTVLSRETALALSLEGVDGVAFYSYASLFAPEEKTASTVSAEMDAIRELLS